MTLLTCSKTNQAISLNKLIADTGEGKVWETDRKGYLAKIYHFPTPERVEKLERMIAHPPKEPNSHLNHISFAWPSSLLRDSQGNCVGFLMLAIADAKEILDVYSPKRRKDLKLEVDWRFLHTTALNIASIIQAIHTSGYVLGDIKPQNILVNNRALPSIIDTDSFQVRHRVTGKVYRCLVGSEGFTPPELIGKDFPTIEQSEVHDRFRLAVIIYYLLFGSQPFQGKWIGQGDSPEVNDLIRCGFWPYAPNSLIQPSEITIPLNIVHPEIQRYFSQCFNLGHTNPNLRPTAEDWVQALKVATDQLSVCGKIDNHYFSQTYGKCYWCERANNLGFDIFPTIVRTKSQSKVVAATDTQQVVQQKEQMAAPLHNNTNQKPNPIKYSPWNPFSPTERDIQRTQELALKNAIFVGLLTYFLPFTGMIYLNRGINNLKIIGYLFLLLVVLGIGNGKNSGSAKDSEGTSDFLLGSCDISMIVENVRAITLARKRLASQKQTQK